ncbi:AraC family transcriptional regulator [Rhizobium sp. LjRoot98]|uniref:AraC family transcriptional regulator n=1 Tax=unclassified Rhizobium TaxID=2613769 RepID=UPI000715E2A5|nr:MULTISPECIES: AraC family transcriptional regulator [unclassified Rhizobium]KQV40754.1 AraC family transcriptional regulator [Rhizobium sp. Root1204]KQY17141.1 AraC family transcriptional regulator [Rhizobium sp. Root1334]KRC13864.1 AraC family transcriptional regulator [Rhizobium sp. Root73]
MSDSIKVAPVSGGIERIEAHFHGNAFEPHRHDTYALGLTLQGVQAFRYRGMVRYSQPGNIIVLHPDELHDGGAGTDEGLRYRMMYLPPEMLAEALGDTPRGLPFVPSPVIADRTFAAHLAGVMHDLDGAIGGLQLDEMLTGIADALLRHSDGGGKARMKRADQTAIRRACDFLQAHSDRQVNSDELEAITGLDRFTLARQFRAALGTSPHRYLVMRRLERARAMIGNGKSLVEIALDTGFADQAHFTRHFKKTHGMTPGRWASLCGRT